MSKQNGAAIAVASVGSLLALALTLGGAQTTQASSDNSAAHLTQSNTGIYQIKNAPQGQSTATPTGTPGCISSWNIVPSANVGTLSNWLNGVAFDNSNAGVEGLWAVGYYENGTGGEKNSLIERWNGAQWDVVPSPNVGGEFDETVLNAVTEIDPEHAWAVGYYRGPYAKTHTLIESWDGHAWSIVPSPDGDQNSNYLLSVSAASPDDAWAVGYAQVSSGAFPQTLALHWDGHSWNVVSTPNVDSYTNVLNSVSAGPSNDTWAVGYSYDAASDALKPLFEHWNGSAWSIVASKAVDFGVLQSVTGSGNDAWAAGYYDASGGHQALLEHWDGTSWSVVSSPSPGLSSELNGLAPFNSGSIWAVGHYFDADTSHSLVLHWDGVAWTQVPAPDAGSNSNDLLGVVAGYYDEAWAVGNSHNTGAGAQNTLVEHYISSCATPQPTISPTATPTECNVSFSDVPASNPFYAYIKCLACKGIITGYADGTFKPNNLVTRGQAAKIVSNAAGFADQQATQMFADVPVGSTFQVYIGRLATRGYISGYNCGGTGEPCAPSGLPYFRPNTDITRGQLSKLIAMSGGFHGIPGFQIFEDVTPGSTFYTYTQLLGQRSIMTGYQCGAPNEPCDPPYERHYFRPDNNATRGQTAKIVSGAFVFDCPQQDQK